MHIDQFVERHSESISIRRDLVLRARNGKVCPDAAGALASILRDIESSVDADGNLHVEIAGNRVATRADYERTELARDIRLAESGMDDVVRDVMEQYPEISSESYMVAERLGGRQFEACFTDRDGTVNGYSNRYSTSVQPAHVALALDRYALAACRHFVILTAGPLEGPGILDLSVLPPSTAVFAASKGRQIVLADGERLEAHLSNEQRDALETLAAAIATLYETERFAPFRYVGSGLQAKFGECSVAYQDWQSNCPQALSQAFRAAVEEQIRRIDADGRIFHLEDGGRDLEISALGADAASFDKGDGLRFVAEHGGIDLSGRSILVCGDTASDLPMVRCADESGASLETVFVTRSDDLAARVRAIDPDALCVTRYESLVLGMYLAVMEETHEFMVV